MDIIIPPCNLTSHLSDIFVSETKEGPCEDCGGEISGTAFYCQLCNVSKHISCADKLNRDRPLKIIHPLHLQHRLQLERDYSQDFICDKCLYISTGYRYRCSSCDFVLDLTCASSVSGQLPKDQEPLRFKDGKKKTIFHHSHRHVLSFFKYRKLREEDYDCFWCEKHLLPSEVCYGCTGSTHKYHRHPLSMMELLKEDDSEKYYCDVCENERNPKDPVYYCQNCTFIAHIQCVLDQSLFRPIIHPHQMYEITEELKGGNYCSGCRLVEDKKEIRKNIHEERFREELKILVARFMKLLSNECRPPIEEVIQAGVVPRFVELLGSPSDYVREQAVLALGNIAAGSLRCRDLVLGHGALPPLLALLNEPVSRSILRKATWTLSTFCKPPFHQV
ncbi:hypothetical protein J1N35_023555 [Gossypium stocksii]|uniref:DC1 domain-containing protein n=1 Tax=Gossypium stocksii TaxID=47602 RepID=A0A9D3VKH1_9ROSI|nr:hypothetical protein J1N35_023555 [Gossypium stocksii]